MKTNLFLSVTTPHLPPSILRQETVSTLPQSPEKLLEELIAIFPQYRSHYTAESDGDAPTYHSVLTQFTCFFGTQLASFSEEQLRSLGTLVSAAVAQPGPLENAFGTCMLEHLHQIAAWRALRPYLSKAARENI